MSTENLQSRLNLLRSVVEWYAAGNTDEGTLAKSVLETEKEQQRRQDVQKGNIGDSGS